MKLNQIKPLAQRNPKWGNKLLGFNTETYTIGSHGCLITCLSMLVEDAVDFMNERLKGVNGFHNGGLYVWGSISKLYPNIKESVTYTPNYLTDAKMRIITDAIANGNPVMLQIDAIPETAKTDMHYVLCVDCNPEDENDLTINDPWEGKQLSLKHYLRGTRKSARSSIEQIIVYSGTGHASNVETPVETIPEPQEGMLEELEELRETVSELRKTNDELRVQRIRDRDDIKKLRLSKELMEKEAAEYIAHIKELEHRVSEFDVANAKMVIDMDKLQTEVTTSNKKVAYLEEEVKKLMANIKEPKTNKDILLEALKEPARLVLLAIIPVAITMLTDVGAEWAGLVIVVLRFVDKYLHELGKATGDAKKLMGLTRF